MSRLRALMPALASKTYFNYGGQGPLPEPSLAAITTAWRTIQDLGPFTSAVWPYLADLDDRLRRRLAGWAAAPVHRIALTENVTSGCVLPLWGLPWQEGDELLIGDAEHPGVVAACEELARRERLSIRSLPAAHLRGEASAVEAGLLRSLEERLRPRTRLVVLSHLLWNTGQVMPIAAVAERLSALPRRPWLLVDGAQSFGSLPVAGPVDAADIYAFTGHKWCCGPEGLGAVILSERLLAESRPTLIGWRSLSNETAAGQGFRRDARRFEVATSCSPLQAGLERSLALLEAEGGAAERLATIRSRAAHLWSGLGRIPGCRPLLEVPPPAGLVSFMIESPGGLPVAPEWIVARLGERGIWLRTLESPACVRACTHLPTTEEEVEGLLAALASLREAPSG